MQPFIAFYSQNNIIPVTQDLSNLEEHFQRRSALLRHLGLPPGFIEGKSVIEFGPGTGQNAIFTASLKPSRYVCVDGNPASLKRMRQNLATYATPTPIEVVESLIEEFKSEEKFDLVICEGVIPFQTNPKAFARHVGSFVKPGGVLVITSIDGVSFLGECTRRLIADKIIPFNKPPLERLRALRSVFNPHLVTLKNRSRLVDDWIYDNILIPYTGHLFPINHAVDGLSDQFDCYASSPHFLTDWRWYKAIVDNDFKFNENAVRHYYENIINLIDYRVDLPPQPIKLGSAIAEHADEIFELTKKMEASNDLSAMVEAADRLDAIAGAIEPVSKITAESLVEASAFIRKPAGTPVAGAFKSFESFFGRGQQYISFIRR